MKIFWSYARRDDMAPANKVSRLRRAFETALSQTRGEDCSVYIDALALKWGVEWRQEIDRLIDASDGLVAVVTPSYFNSRMCLFELQTALSARKTILPIYYRTCRTLASSFKEDGNEAEINRELNKASLAIARVQMKDFRPLRNARPDTPEVEDFLDSLAEQLT